MSEPQDATQGSVSKELAPPSSDPTVVRTADEGSAYCDDPEVVNNRDFSDLEADHTQNLSDPQVVPLPYSNLEVSTAEHLKHGGIQAYHPGVGSDASGPIPFESHPAHEQGQRERKILGLKPQAFLLSLAVLVVIIVGAVVGGVVGGLQGSHKDHHRSSSSNTHGTSSGNQTSGNVTHTPQHGILEDSLAAIAWQITSTHYRYAVYFQDADTSIKQSQYDSSTASWTVSTVVSSDNVRVRTPLAASSPKGATNGQDWVPINVYFLAKNLSVAMSSYDGSAWRQSVGPMATAADARLSSYYLKCALCPNTTLVAAASDGAIKFYNGSTFDSWELDAVTTLGISVLEGSDLSFQPFSLGDYADQLNLYYQRPDEALVLATWFSWQYQRDNNLDLPNGWQENGNNGVVSSKLSPNVSIAAFYFGSNPSEPAQPQYVEVATNSPKSSGLDVYWWTNSLWQSSLTPATLQDIPSSSSLAAHRYQRLYAMDNGMLNEYAVNDNGTGWQAIGNVPTS